MASVRRIGTGRYRVAWHVTPKVGPHAGQVFRGSRVFHDRAVAQEFCAQRTKLDNAIRDGQPLGLERPRDLLDEFLAAYEMRSAATTFDRADRCLPGMLGWLEANDVDMLADITPAIVLRYQQHRTDVGIAASSVNREVSVLSTFLDWCVAQRHIDTHPFSTAVDQVASETTAAKRLPTPAELRRIIRAIRPQDRHTAWKIIALYSTGLRISELCDALVTEVDLHNRTWHILGKGKKRRDVRLHGNTLFAVKSMIRYAQAKRSKYLACTRRGRRLNRTNMGATLRRLCKKVGVEPFGPHVLRHCFGTWHAAGGTPMPDLQVLMGHESITTTIENYFHYAPKDTAEMARTFRRGRRPSSL